jgi:hypothetical protein
MKSSDENKRFIMDGHVSSFSRRRFLQSGTAALTGGAAWLSAPLVGSAAADEPVRIGMVLSKQGAFAQQAVIWPPAFKLPSRTQAARCLVERSN